MTGIFFMSSINSHYTFKYSQPDEYHFSHDSVFLARRVSDLIKSQELKSNYVLDLCAGCGIVGLDLVFHLGSDCKIKTVDFVEIQECYKPHFLKNAASISKLLLPMPKLNFINKNYDTFVPDLRKYDVIVCNPPYFRKGHGALSKSDFKNRCRFFIDSDFVQLIRAIDISLSSVGKAFILLKSLNIHGIDLEKEFLELKLNLRLIKLPPIRKTDFYEISRL